MSLLLSLGVNSTLAIQLAIFLTVFVILKYGLFAPYFKAFNQRTEATVGQTDLAERYVNETKELEEKFASEAQNANERFRAVYDESRGHALKEYDRLVSEARAKTKSLIDDARLRIQKEVAAAEAEIAKEIPDVAKVINQQLLGKDLST